MVSVPCRGTTFLNFSFFPLWESWDRVSVPCRGTTFLNQIYMNCIIINISVSVPCRGTTFLNPLKICKDYNTSFRPLSGNYISQSFNGVYYERGIHCFRPLSGNYISQCITITVKEILDNVSVPCRGTTFLNTNLLLRP